MSLQPWTVRAVNLPEHADNPVHTDVGAQAAGFPRALVAGVTTYAVLTRPVVADDATWIERGAGEVRFIAPVFDTDLIELTPADPGGVGALTSVDALVEGTLRARLTVLDPAEVSAHLATTVPTEPPLAPTTVTLSGTYADYGTRAGDDLALYTTGVIHSSVWLNLANRVFAQQLVDGSWVHTRSRFVHRSSCRVGDVVTVTGSVVRRFTSGAGERAVAVLQIAAGDEPVVDIEHEAIVSMHRDER